MRYFRLYDFLAPEGEFHRVDEETGQVWALNSKGQDVTPAFTKSAKLWGTSQYDQLKAYALRYGRLEDAECPEN